MAISTDYEKKLRAAEIVRKTVLEGKSKMLVAKEMGISHDTLTRTMQWAEGAQLFVEYEKRLYDELLPLAHNAVKMALEDGDAQVGLKILEGIRLLNKNAPASKAQQESEEGLYEEIARIRAGNVINVSPGRSALESAGNQLDVIPLRLSVAGIDGESAGTAGQGQSGEDHSKKSTEGDET